MTLMLVPMTLACLGEYTNGVWLTIGSTLLLIDNLDIGLGNGLRNKLTNLVAQNQWEKARVAVSSTIVLLSLLIVPVTLLLIYEINSVDIYSLLNVNRSVIPNLNAVLCACVILFGSTFIMKFIGNVYLALQLPAVSNFLVTGGHPFILLGTYYMYVQGIHSLMYIAILNMSVPLIMYIIAYPYTFFCKYPQLKPSLGLFSVQMTRELFSTGVMFFLNQISSAVVLFSSNIMMSRWFSPSLVTPYQIAYRYFSIPFLVFTIINAPNWSATADAFQRNDIDWIKKSLQRMGRILFFFCLSIIVMILLSQSVYNIWIGDQAHVSLSMTLTVGLYMYMMIYSLAYCYYLNGVGALRLQLYCMLVGVLLYFVSAYILYWAVGDVVAIPIAVSISLLPNAIFNRIQIEKIINNKAKGLWRK